MTSLPKEVYLHIPNPVHAHVYELTAILQKMQQSLYALLAIKKVYQLLSHRPKKVIGIISKDSKIHSSFLSILWKYYYFRRKGYTCTPNARPSMIEWKDIAKTIVILRTPWLCAWGRLFINIGGSSLTASQFVSHASGSANANPLKPNQILIEISFSKNYEKNYLNIRKKAMNYFLKKARMWTLQT